MTRSPFLRSSIRAGLSLAALTCAAIPSREALACGACFHEVGTPTVVSGHRMVLSVSADQTVLWDQIQYAGDPAEFAWVLPVKPGAYVEESTAAFFEVLESATVRRIEQPPVDCGGGGGISCGCRVELADDGAYPASDGADKGVNVVHQGTVGPYETVTLQTTQPGALNTWLSDHGYAVDSASQPVVDAYVAEGFDFIALRLQPGKGITQMTPVRVISAGATPVLPLRMVAIGTGATVPIILDVIGEGRWTTQNFPEVHLQTPLLAWDFEAKSSNYAELRKQALAANAGRSWLTAFAQDNALQSTIGTGPDGFTPISLSNAYFSQALSNGEISTACAKTLPTAGVVKNPCPAGEPWDSPLCGTVAPGDIDVRTISCDGAEDIATALVGMHLGTVWITRLEADLPHAALDTDLTLAAAPQQEPVSRILTANIAINPDAACPSGGPPTHVGGDSRPPRNLVSVLIASVLAAFGMAFVARRHLGKAARRAVG